MPVSVLPVCMPVCLPEVVPSESTSPLLELLLLSLMIHPPTQHCFETRPHPPAISLLDSMTRRDKVPKP